MMRSCLAVLVFALSACTSAFPTRSPTASPCAAGEATYACQVERYKNVSGL